MLTVNYITNIFYTLCIGDCKGELKRQESEVDELRFFHLSELSSLNISHGNKPALRAYLTKRNSIYKL